MYPLNSCKTTKKISENYEVKLMKFCHIHSDLPHSCFSEHHLSDSELHLTHINNCTHLNVDPRNQNASKHEIMGGGYITFLALPMQHLTSETYNYIIYV